LNVRILYRADPFITLGKEIAKLYTVGVEGVTWDRDGTEPAGKYTFLSMERGTRNLN
jgi:hypothetical protein